MNLLIHADPGARSGFLAAWLTDCVTKLSFDSGKTLKPQYYKIHKLDNASSIERFVGLKIRIKPSIETIDLHSLLFLRKNVYDQMPAFTKNEYSLETLTKLVEFAKEIFEWDSELDYSLYTYAVDFKDTFDTDFMVEFYEKIRHSTPNNLMIETLIETNKINNLDIDKNHVCSILKTMLVRERELGLKEDHRFWSIVDIYNSTPVEKLHDTVCKSIMPENYGIYLQN